MIINVYDFNFDLIGTLDTYSSVIWRPAYYDVGDFEVYAPANSEILDLLQVNNFLVRTQDISVDDSGNVTYKNVMIIKNIKLITDIENGDKVVITGRELKFILHQRIVWSQTVLSGNIETALRRLVSENASSPTLVRRRIPNLSLGALSGLTETLNKQLTGEYLDEAIQDICATYNIGWDIYGYNNSYVFVVYSGLDRSYNQSERPYVVFSDKFDNLYNTDYQLETENYANTALIAGEGEGTARKSTTINNSATGLSRYELYVDARDLSQNKDSTDPSEVISDSDYLNLLKERGSEKLAEADITEGFSGEIFNSNFIYGTDFYLGDVVTITNSYGITKNVRVLSAIESDDENGITLIPQFNF